MRQHAWKHRLIGWSGSLLIRAWFGTMRQSNCLENWTLYPHGLAHGRIYAIWHESILGASYANRDNGIHVLISQSRDGEYISRIVEQLGYRTVRGSSSRGSLHAVRELNRMAGQSALAITPDGPRGPRHVFQLGAIYLASRAGIPIVPVGVAYGAAWRAKSWDRFVVPVPFSRIAFCAGPPIHVPADLNPSELESFRQTAQSAMEKVERHAQRLLGQTPCEVDPCTSRTNSSTADDRLRAA